MKLQAPSSSSPTTALIAGVDRGGLSYPTLPFVGFVHHLEQAASRVTSVLVKGPQPLKKFSAVVLPSLLKSPLFHCAQDKSVPHKTKLVSVILQKFMRPFLSNTANGLTVCNAKKKEGSQNETYLAKGAEGLNLKARLSLNVLVIQCVI